MGGGEMGDWGSGEAGGQGREGDAETRREYQERHHLASGGGTAGQSQMAFIEALTHPQIELEPCSNGVVLHETGGMRFRLDQFVREFFPNF